MNDANKQLEIAVQKLAGTFNKDFVEAIYCDVISVDESKRTCTCKPINGKAETEIPGVLLSAEANDGLLLVPKVGSTILVAITKSGDPCAIMFSDLDKLKVRIGKTEFSVATLITFKTETESLKSILSDLIDQIELITVTPESLGVPTPPPNNAPAFAAIAARLNALLT